MTGIIVFVTAIVVVLATSLLKSERFTSSTKNFIAMGVSVIAGAVATVIENGGFSDFETAGLVGTILMVYGAATAIYKFILPEGVDEKIEGLFDKRSELEKHIPGQYNYDQE